MLVQSCSCAQVDNKDTLNCYYAHCQQFENLQVSVHAACKQAEA